MEKAITVWLETPTVEKDGDFYSAYSSELELVGCGLTEDDATRNLEEAISTSLKALHLKGMLFATLDTKRIAYKEVLPPTTVEPSSSSLKPMLVGAI